MVDSSQFKNHFSRMSATPAKRGAKVIERPGLSEDEIEEIREAFNLFDAGKCSNSP